MAETVAALAGRLSGGGAAANCSAADPDLSVCLGGLARFAGKDRSGFSPELLLGCLDALARAGKQVESLTAALAEEAQRRGSAARAEGLDVESHLRAAQNLPAGQARRLVEQGKALRPFEVMSRAAQAGTLAPAQAGACARELGDFPAEELGDAALRQAELELVGEARRLGARALGLKARKLVDQARRQAGVGGDRADQLDRERERARRERFLSLKPDGQVMVISGRCPIDVGVKMKKRLAAAVMAAGRERTDRGNGGGPVRDDSGRLWDPANGGGAVGESFGASMMDALAAVVDSYPCGGAPLQAGRPARIVVTMTVEQLAAIRRGADPAGDAPRDPAGGGDGGREGGGAFPGGVLEDGGEELAPEATRLAACEAEWLAVLVGSFGQPLDVGRATRSVPPSIRAALNERDRGCCFPGCGVGPDGCEAHHVDKWALGCPTSLAKLVLACHQHHRILEPAMKLADGRPWAPGLDDPDRWRAEIDPVHQHPVVIPPARVDPERKPRLNDRIRLKLENAGALTASEPAPSRQPPPAAADDDGEASLSATGRSGDPAD
ncbi:MAG: HNH endonuclease [Bifidobacteriaceae bacterium]|nr:HNH endonuclease [Bifidobacteriaceae bacterium]